MIHDQIKEDMKTAMKERQAVKLSVIRGLLAAFTNEAVTLGKKPDDKLTDEEALTVLKRAANQRKDAAEQFVTGGRADLAENEKEELAVIENYLPTPMSRDNIKNIALKKTAELNITDKSKMGLLIGAIMKEAGATADGNLVKEVVEEILA